MGSCVMFLYFLLKDRDASPTKVSDLRSRWEQQIRDNSPDREQQSRGRSISPNKHQQGRAWSPVRTRVESPTKHLFGVSSRTLSPSKELPKGCQAVLSPVKSSSTIHQKATKEDNGASVNQPMRSASPSHRVAFATASAPTAVVGSPGKLSSAKSMASVNAPVMAHHRVLSPSKSYGGGMIADHRRTSPVRNIVRLALTFSYSFTVV